MIMLNRGPFLFYLFEQIGIGKSFCQVVTTCTFTISGYMNKLNSFYVSISCLAEDDKNNQFLQNDGTSQKLSRDEIMNLKAQGVSGKVH